jgi:uncharacterized membrane protein YtjA (UPF0391 family)
LFHLFPTATAAAKYRLTWISLAALHAYDRERPTAANFLRRNTMLYWTLMFLVVAIIAAVLGFTGIAVAAAGVAKLLFFVFLVLFVLSLVTHLARRSSSV